METAVLPDLKPGEKIHYPIFHDECCIHANDQCTYVWMREGEQPLRDKSRGQIVHVSDLIVEHSGRLCLWEFLCDEQMKLPVEPTRPVSPSASAVPPVTATAATSAAKKARGRKSKKKASQPSEPCRTLDQTNEWVPPPPPAPFKSYRLPCFNAHQIIYPGANHDPWWDMPQLIAQVCNLLSYQQIF